MPATAFVRACLPALLLASAPALHAQAPAYARTPADTLRYREVMQGTANTSGMAGGRSEHSQDTRIAITWLRGDTAHAWYEGMRAQTKQGNSSGHGYSRLTSPPDETAGGFTLAVAASGRARTLRIPQLEPGLDVEADSILRTQFLDFFPVLPDQPLRIGLEWTEADSLDVLGGWWRRTTQSRVLRDTVVDGVSAFVVETESRIAWNRFSELDWEMSFRTEMQGTERGRYVFAPAPGLLLRRERTGTLQGTETTLLDGEQPRAARQTREYTITQELLSGARE